MTQYRTLGEGDRRLPGCEYDEGRQGRWNPCPPCMIGERISRVDADAAAYRVPCNATVAPNGYEVVQRDRLPGWATAKATWFYWSEPSSRWLSVEKFQGRPVGAFRTLAAPAGELTALYAQGDAEREQPAQSVAYRIAREFRDRYEHVSRSVGWQTQEACRTWFDQLPEVNLRAMIKTVECLLKAGVIAPGTAFEMWPVEQHAPTAPASPWVYVGDRLPPVNVRVVVSTAPRGDDPRPSVILTWSGERWYRDSVWYSGAVHWLDLAAVDRLAAECEELRRERDEARAKMADARRGWDAAAKERDRLAAENAELMRERDDARAEVAEVRRAWDATVEARDDALAELERLRGCVDASRRRADRAESGLEAVTKAYEASRAEVERLRGEVARLRRDADHVGELRRRIAAAGAALEGRDG